MAKHSSLLSRLLQFTALIFFIYAGYRLYRYFYGWLLFEEYMIYAIFLAICIGIGILIHDEVFKPGSDFVGWAFLFGVGFLSFLIGLIFVFIPIYPAPPSLFFGTFWSRAIFFMVMGVIVIIESLLIRREVIPGKHGLNSDTVGPVVLKFASIFALAWGGYQMAWVIIPYIRDVPLISMMPIFLSALGNVLFGGILLLYVESQKRKPHFRARRLPLLMSFLLLLMIIPLIAFYITIYMTIVATLELLLNGIMGLGIALALVINSFYIVYHPTKAR
ncbi:MAG: hypothetical protein ACFFD8_02555 [Candidatus Thorarchaeota archaeon]